MAAVQIDPALLDEDPALADKVALTARKHGVLTRTLAGGSLQISPALVITRAELDELAGGIAAALDAVAARLGAPAPA
jgi:adenosylmethionine-8-amino-7-oxononanoate aminotransferase